MAAGAYRHVNNRRSAFAVARRHGDTRSISEKERESASMLLYRVTPLFRNMTLRETNLMSKSYLRSTITTPSGAILPEPKRTPFSLLGVISSVVFGLLVGATISKNMANFLEENDLFVPSDDDDDDD